MTGRLCVLSGEKRWIIAVFWIGFLFSFGIIVQHSALLKKKALSKNFFLLPSAEIQLSLPLKMLLCGTSS
jgi:hypothetical protein